MMVSVHDGAGAQLQPSGLQNLANGGEQLLAQAVVPSLRRNFSSSGAVGHALAPEVDTHEAAQRGACPAALLPHASSARLNQCCTSTLRSMPQSGRAPVARLGVVRLDQLLQCIPRHDLVHRGQEHVALGGPAIPFRSSPPLVGRHGQGLLLHRATTGTRRMVYLFSVALRPGVARRRTSSRLHAGDRTGARLALSRRTGYTGRCKDGFLYPAMACGACTACASAPAPRSSPRWRHAAALSGAMLMTRARRARPVLRCRAARCRRRHRTPDGDAERSRCDALLLACNGFGGNAAMVHEWLPAMRSAVFAGHAGNDGSAIAWGARSAPGSLTSAPARGTARGRCHTARCCRGRR